jgi:hypothetical protein
MVLELNTRVSVKLLVVALVSSLTSAHSQAQTPLSEPKPAAQTVAKRKGDFPRLFGVAHGNYSDPQVQRNLANMDMVLLILYQGFYDLPIGMILRPSPR